MRIFLSPILILAPLALPWSGRAQSCPFLGSAYQPPKNLSKQAIWQSFAVSFSTSLKRYAEAGNSPYGTLSSNVTSFSVHVAAVDSGETVFDFHHTAPSRSPHGTSKVDKDTIYRVASISKLFTTYATLLNAGSVDVFQEPITKYLPKLNEYNAKRNDIDQLRWDQITVGALSSHLAGIPRDYFTTDAGLGWFDLTPIGLPPLDPAELPTCNIHWPSCTPDLYLAGINDAHPTFPAFYSPAYSNVAFNILGLALENITNRSYSDALNKLFLKRLNMTSTGVTKPRDSLGAIPESKNAWGVDLGKDKPAGGVYTSSADLAKLGVAILNHTLLSERETRRWLKPHTHTNSLLVSVGAPFEIYRHRPTNVTSYVIDLYTKDGTLPGYSSWIVLVPEYNVVISLLAAGEQILGALRQTVLSAVLPALQNTTRQQASDLFAGSYEAVTPGLNTSLTLIVDDPGPGLLVKSLVTNGTALPILLRTLGLVTANTRLYPTGLRAQGRKYSPSSDPEITEYLGFKVAFDLPPPTGPRPEGFLPELSGCIAWGAVDGLVYGNVGLDEVVIGVGKDGKAREIELRGLRVVLRRKGGLGNTPFAQGVGYGSARHQKPFS